MKKRKGLIAALVFLVLVIAGGVLLSTSGNWENPFASVLGEQHREGGEGAPPTRSEGSGESPAGRAEPPSDRPAMGGSNETIQIAWSQFGHVLYNLWFLFAASAVMMVIGISIKSVRKYLRQPQPA